MSITAHFSHKTIRRIVVSFATLFNNYQVQKPDGTYVDVPLTWSSKAKWYTMMQQDPDKANLESRILPRMGFSISDIVFDSRRKVSSINKITKKNEADSTKAFSTYTPVPYNINFELFMLSKTVDEGIQLLEQIIPFFTPSFSISITEIDELEILRDIPIKLTSVNSDFDREGDFDGDDVYEWSLSFTVEANLYKNIEEKSIIKNVVFDSHIQGIDEEELKKERYKAIVDPQTAYIDSEYEILESLGLIDADVGKLE